MYYPSDIILMILPRTQIIPLFPIYAAYNTLGLLGHWHEAPRNF